jgi:hypothetical protein
MLQNEEEILEKKRQVQASLVDMLSQIVSSRIGQRRLSEGQEAITKRLL